MTEPDDETDWFGYRLTPREGGGVDPTPCPFCDERFEDRHVFETHLADRHAVRTPSRPARHRATRLRRWWDSLGYLPLWYVAPIDLVLVAIVIMVLTPYGWWITAYGAALATFPLVLVLSHRIFRPPG